MECATGKVSINLFEIQSSGIARYFYRISSGFGLEIYLIVVSTYLFTVHL